MNINSWRLEQKPLKTYIQYTNLKKNSKDKLYNSKSVNKRERERE